ncbi:hypothetical protein BJ508DRAFT_312858 [Ascobolus immersus RN42]|uniref:Uncharacterized protein n=1 Tax=Ascobolus immersus RN42 TaxID=1160509 RepID=A0A3N4HKX8_ASCIM|nr:hypothetical protein BJ508DRAFT_312858 [Ascobolus immersus RN42]
MDHSQPQLSDQSQLLSEKNHLEQRCSKDEIVRDLLAVDEDEIREIFKRTVLVHSSILQFQLAVLAVVHPANCSSGQNVMFGHSKQSWFLLLEVVQQFANAAFLIMHNTMFYEWKELFPLPPSAIESRPSSETGLWAEIRRKLFTGNHDASLRTSREKMERFCRDWRGASQVWNLYRRFACEDDVVSEFRFLRRPGNGTTEKEIWWGSLGEFPKPREGLWWCKALMDSMVPMMEWLEREGFAKEIWKSPTAAAQATPERCKGDIKLLGSYERENDADDTEPLIDLGDAA